MNFNSTIESLKKNKRQVDDKIKKKFGSNQDQILMNMSSNSSEGSPEPYSKEIQKKADRDPYVSEAFKQKYIKSKKVSKDSSKNNKGKEDNQPVVICKGG